MAACRTVAGAAIRALAMAGMVTGFGAGAASAATLKADYQLQDTLRSDVAGAPALTDLVGTGGPNAFSTENVNGAPRRVLTFPKGNGVAMSSVSSLLPSASYSAVMLVRLADISGYRRYLDLTGGAADNGFYNLSGRLVLYSPASGTSTPITANAYHQVAVTRDASGIVAGYVDGAPALGPYDDSSTAAAALATDTMRFFKDDDVVLGEDSAGAVSRIRVYEGALTAAEVAALSPPRPPPPDSDGDGVRDSADTCPTVPAPTPDGCPRSTAPPPPVLAKSVNVEPVKGQVFVSVPAGAARASATVPGIKGRRFVALSQAKQIPVGSLLDTRRGTVRLTSASGSGTATQSSDFVSGVFEVRQSGKGSAKGLTELRLKGSSFSRCATRGKRSSTRSAASKRRIRPPAWQRNWSLPHARTLQRGHRSGHRLDGDRPLRRDAHHRQERERRGA